MAQPEFFPGMRVATKSNGRSVSGLSFTSLRKIERRLTALEAENRALRCELASRNGETHFRKVIDASPVPLSVDDMKGTIEYLNRKFEKKFGYSHKEIPTSIAWFARAYPNPSYRRQVADQWEAYLKRGLRAGNEVRPPEVEVTCKDGSLRRVEFIGTLLGDRLLIAANDVTERDRLEKQILEISDEERERIGQDLHDGLCQLLSGIKFKTTLLEQKLQSKDPAEALDAHAIEGLINTAIEQARNIARGLHPVDLEARGLMSALEELSASVANLYGIRCFCDVQHPVLVHDHLVATHLYRIAQEAINNALRHGHSTIISVRLSGRGTRLCLMVQDNGSGFPTSSGPKTGMGLHLMNYRARAIGGTIEIGPAPTQGTLVTCRVGEMRFQSRNTR